MEVKDESKEYFKIRSIFSSFQNRQYRQPLVLNTYMIYIYAYDGFFLIAQYCMVDLMFLNLRLQL